MELENMLIATTSRNHNWDVVLTQYGNFNTPEEAAHALINQIDDEGTYAVGDISVYRITSCRELVGPEFVSNKIEGPWMLYDYGNGKRYEGNGEPVKKFRVYATYELVEAEY